MAVKKEVLVMENPNRCLVCKFFSGTKTSSFGKCSKGYPKFDNFNGEAVIMEGKVHINWVCEEFKNI